MGALTVFHKLGIFANRTPSKYSQIEKKSLLMVILAKLLFTGFTEELASITRFVSCACFDMGHIAAALFLTKTQRQKV